ncbi:hypothetical protein [Azotobacter vinelandii]|uniref:hypothetical protein n=1 Tax=Azotobacter vinelandii TaxID=354 RepID=UPI000917F85A|nr:hypothetical protein [Azotobacter vinelandii]SFY32619.1 hypothetical protein SAMN04244547_05113 [Azotobacter vinelandii]
MSTQFEAAKARAEKTIRHYVGLFESKAEGCWPTEEFCDGLIAMAYTTGHLDEVGVQYWEQNLKRIKEDRWKASNVKIGVAA